jgi:sugar (pentulose or hexulose) kinase
MFGASVVVPETAEGSARGAAMLAMLALGEKSHIADFAPLCAPLRRIAPVDGNRLYYQDQYKKFLNILDQTRHFY